MDRNVLLAVAAAQEAWDEAGDRGVRPGARRHPRRLRDRRHRDDRRAAADLPRARRRPRLAVLHPLGARRHGERPDRDPARDHRPELRAGLGLRDGLDRDRRGRRDDRRAARPTSSSRAAPRRAIIAAHPRRLLRHAGPRGRGRRPDARHAPVRRDAGRLRDGGGGLHPRARGARGGEGPRRHDLRRGDRLRRLERRAPPRPARARGNRRRGDDQLRADGGGRRSRARRLRQRARHLDAARRSRRDAGAAPGVRRARVRARGLVDEVGHRPLLRCRRRGRGDDVRAGAAPPGAAADDQLPEPRSRSSTSTTSRTRRARSTASSSRSRTRWASAATTAASCSAATTAEPRRRPASARRPGFVDRRTRARRAPRSPRPPAPSASASGG